MPQGYIGGGGDPDHNDYARVRLAVLRLALLLPPCARAEARADVIDTLKEQFLRSGEEVPAWLERLREELG